MNPVAVEGRVVPVVVGALAEYVAARQRLAMFLPMPLHIALALAASRLVKQLHVLAARTVCSYSTCSLFFLLKTVNVLFSD